MKKETILKILTIVMTGIIIGVMSTNVFAATTDKSLYDDLTNNVDQSQDGVTVTDPDKDKVDPEKDKTNPDEKTENVKENNYGTDIPKAGAAENTVMIVAGVALSVVAVVTYNKMKYYKNI